MFTKRWVKHFEEHIEKFESLDFKMRRHWEYLSTVFERVNPEIEIIKAKGDPVGTCRVCHFEAVPFESEYDEYLSGNCLVCKWRSTELNVKCVCGEKMSFANDGFQSCTSCGKNFEPQDLRALILEMGFETGDWNDSKTPASCSFCDGYQTVVCFHDEYICTSCLELFEGLEQCDHCGDYCTGDMGDSGWKGCVICDGSAG